jgi:topoisomerase IA-like protein
MMKIKVCQFDERSDWEEHYSEETLNLFLLPKNLGEYKEKKLSNGRYGPIFAAALHLYLAKRREPIRC